MKNSNAITGNTELKRLAEVLPQLPWSYEANGFILAWDGTERSRCESVGGFYYVCEGVSNFREYLLALEPAKVLALIAENDSQHKDLQNLRSDNAQLTYALNQQEQGYLVLLAERDQLRAEIAGLKTGYEAYERVNAELKAEVGVFRGLLREMRAIGNHAPAELTLRIDAAMSKGERS